MTEKEQIEELLEVAMKRFKTFGFKSVTMDELAEDLGKSKKTLYTLVDSKKTLIHMVLDKDLSRDIEALREISLVSEDAISELFSIAKYYVGILTQQSPQGLKDLQRYYKKAWEKVNALHTEFMFEKITNNITRGQKEGLFRQDLDVDLVARFLLSISSGIVKNEPFDIFNLQWSNTFRQILKYHILGISTNQGVSLYNEKQKSFK